MPKKKKNPKSGSKSIIFLILVFLLTGITLGYLVGIVSVIIKPTFNPYSVENTESTDPVFTENHIIYKDKSLIKPIEDLENVIVNLDDDPTRGSHDAPITIIEFSDYQCEFCREFFNESYLDIDKNYVETGKVHYVFRDFPLLIHPQSIIAATTANCAGEQDKYWEMHNLIFTNQEAWSYNKDAQKILRNLASTLKLNMEEFDKCFLDERNKIEIGNDATEGSIYGVTVTPTLFINNQKVVIGSQTNSLYKEIIENELKKAEEAKQPELQE